MITAIAQLGQALRRESYIGELLDRTKAKNILVFKFKMTENAAEYIGIDIEEKGADELYLYRRDLAGRWIGLFLTGRITRFDLLNLQRKLKQLENGGSKKDARNSVDKFLEKKLDGISRSAIANDENLISNLEANRRKTLKSVIDGFRKQSKQIHKDFLREILKLEAEELLITVGLIDRSRKLHVGEVPEFVNMFKMAVTETRKKAEEPNTGVSPPACCICNKDAETAKFRQPPLPFVTTDKPGFIASGDFKESYKVFPLCTTCFSDLQRGKRFIEDHLDFSVSSIEGKTAQARFWLVPVITNPELVLSYIEDVGKGVSMVEGKVRFLYLSHLRNMCERMDAVTTAALDYDDSAPDAFMTFTALFYLKDTQGHMRLMLSSEGIYPRRLRALVDAKRMVDSLYPFAKMGIRFGFPLLREFLAPISEQGRGKSVGWYKELASVLADMFTDKVVSKDLLYKAIALKIQKAARKGPDLQKITDSCFRALSLIEYIEHLQPSVFSGIAQ